MERGIEKVLLQQCHLICGIPFELHTKKLYKELSSIIINDDSANPSNQYPFNFIDSKEMEIF